MMLGLRLPLVSPGAELSPTVLVSTVCALSGLAATAYRYGVLSERRRRVNHRLSSELDRLRAEVQHGFAGIEKRVRAVEDAFAHVFDGGVVRMTEE